MRTRCSARNACSRRRTCCTKRPASSHSAQRMSLFSWFFPQALSYLAKMTSSMPACSPSAWNAECARSLDKRRKSRSSGSHWRRSCLTKAHTGLTCNLGQRLRRATRSVAKVRSCRKSTVGALRSFDVSPETRHACAFAVSFHSTTFMRKAVPVVDRCCRQRPSVQAVQRRCVTHSA